MREVEVMKRTSRVVSVVFVLLMIASLFGTEAFAATANNNPSSDVAARTTGTGTGKSTNTSSSSVSNFKSLKKKTKLEKKAYNKLKKIDSLAVLPNISYVYMDYNEITNVDALADCYVLVQVNVYGNDIDTVSELTAHDIIVNYDPT